MYFYLDYFYYYHHHFIIMMFIYLLSFCMYVYLFIFLYILLFILLFCFSVLVYYLTNTVYLRNFQTFAFCRFSALLKIQILPIFRHSKRLLAPC